MDQIRIDNLILERNSGTPVKDLLKKYNLSKVQYYKITKPYNIVIGKNERALRDRILKPLILKDIDSGMVITEILEKYKIPFYIYKRIIGNTKRNKNNPAKIELDNKIKDYVNNLKMQNYYTQDQLIIKIKEYFGIKFYNKEYVRLFGRTLIY
jgi:Mor family transcriptional regulator